MASTFAIQDTQPTEQTEVVDAGSSDFDGSDLEMIDYDDFSSSDGEEECVGGSSDEEDGVILVGKIRAGSDDGEADTTTMDELPKDMFQTRRKSLLVADDELDALPSASPSPVSQEQDTDGGQVSTQPSATTLEPTAAPISAPRRPASPYVQRLAPNRTRPAMPESFYGLRLRRRNKRMRRGIDVEAVDPDSEHELPLPRGTISPKRVESGLAKIVETDESKVLQTARASRTGYGYFDNVMVGAAVCLVILLVPMFTPLHKPTDVSTEPRTLYRFSRVAIGNSSGTGMYIPRDRTTDIVPAPARELIAVSVYEKAMQMHPSIQPVAGGVKRQPRRWRKCAGAGASAGSVSSLDHTQSLTIVSEGSKDLTAVGAGAAAPETVGTLTLSRMRAAAKTKPSRRARRRATEAGPST
ncbi:hypothetical protein M427DRAFT_134559 [Gonapodya prolifera JEL478]|uniref:Transmembrane protein n=1 Tax=Gonapodya prolifera (strain JEL478) TaxID=1344416 RepID=A0A139AHT4_GONPJ|nr:hypothetical protein M427DRAFT_134559 [Gonapodya prolifera JEL478]|eukprot:KXS16114.1 hypothetical protein M427DRAFT_134559 [Gonapodya prolifera JEL478]